MINYVLLHTIALTIGIVLDLIIGDPYKLPHPIRLIGRLIALLDRLFMGAKENKSSKPGREIFFGGLIAFITLLLTTIITALILVVTYRINGWVGVLAEALLTFYLLAAKSLYNESMKVYKALASDDIVEARRAVSMIVGRDTKALDAQAVTKAAVETVAENTSDGVIAPLLYTALLGPIAGMAYKAINTMDSMLGYHNDRYEYLGKIPARLDDIVNYIPARLSAIYMIIASYILSLFTGNYSGKDAFTIWIRDRYKHKSPNSAQTESVCAGSLGIKLAGPSSYFGKIVDKPYIGDDKRMIEYNDIKRANRLMFLTEMLSFISVIILTCLILSGCNNSLPGLKNGPDFETLSITESVDFQYAELISIDKYEDYYFITIENDNYILIPEGKAVPYNLPEKTTVLQEPFDKTYLVSTSVFDIIDRLGASENIRFSGTKEKDWYIPSAVEAMRSGQVLYAGKYSAPDYEQLLSEGANLAVENTMIYHNPAAKEKLEEVGIPVLVEKSSYESHPLGRLEWIKLYGILYHKENEANEYFDSQVSIISSMNSNKPVKEALKIAFFSVTANGSVTVRKPGDYVSKMIEMAGGEYALKDYLIEEENSLSTMNIQMEDFYAAAADADILIYNSTIEGEISSYKDITDKSQLFKDFKAYKEGRIYCTGKNFFQESTGLAEFIVDLNKIINNSSKDYTYLKEVTNDEK